MIHMLREQIRFCTFGHEFTKYYTIMMTTQDKEQLKQRGISEEQVAEQLKRFEVGFPYLRLKSPASVGQGILSPGAEEQEMYVRAWDDYKKATDKTIVKFVPASGAASRMFKDLFEFIESKPYDAPQTDFEKQFFAGLYRFAFYDALSDACVRLYGLPAGRLVADGQFKEVVRALLRPEGLNYGALPKGLLLFHRYEEGARTPLEEHLAEGAMYACSAAGTVDVHFTVSAEHRELFRQLSERKQTECATRYGADYRISFSEQKPSTDTLAADADNQPFREDGRLLFRPGGHGALIENLNDLDADVIFIKNIDNVVPDRLKSDTIAAKKLIAGVLVGLQEKAFDCLRLLDSGRYTHEQLMEMLHFLEDRLCCINPEIENLEDSELAIYLKQKFNRPIRVCGMVKNEGEPGGGPFMVYNSDGTVSLQILESSQIDNRNPEAKKMFEGGTHFNPVDLVCAVRDYRGRKFDLTKYVDKNTGFISSKSKNGRELKALELPGLWNGAMSDWNTVFVEVPLSTFNPVKTVNDLLRDQHQ